MTQPPQVPASVELPLVTAVAIKSTASGDNAPLHGTWTILVRAPSGALSARTEPF